MITVRCQFHNTGVDVQAVDYIRFLPADNVIPLCADCWRFISDNPQPGSSATWVAPVANRPTNRPTMSLPDAIEGTRQTLLAACDRAQQSTGIQSAAQQALRQLIAEVRAVCGR